MWDRSARSYVLQESNTVIFRPMTEHNQPTRENEHTERGREGAEATGVLGETFASSSYLLAVRNHPVKDFPSKCDRKVRELYLASTSDTKRIHF